MQNNWNSHALLVAVSTGTLDLGKSLTLSVKVEDTYTLCPSNTYCIIPFTQLSKTGKTCLQFRYAYLSDKTIKHCKGANPIKSGKWLPLGRRKEFVMARSTQGSSRGVNSVLFLDQGVVTSLVCNNSLCYMFVLHGLFHMYAVFHYKRVKKMFSKCSLKTLVSEILIYVIHKNVSLVKYISALE